MREAPAHPVHFELAKFPCFALNIERTGSFLEVLHQQSFLYKDLMTQVRRATNSTVSPIMAMDVQAWDTLLSRRHRRGKMVSAPFMAKRIKHQPFRTDSCQDQSVLASVMASTRLRTTNRPLAKKSSLRSPSARRKWNLSLTRTGREIVDCN